MSRGRTIVVGGGIAGLAAAYSSARIAPRTCCSSRVIRGRRQAAAGRGCRGDGRRGRGGDAQPPARGRRPGAELGLEVVHPTAASSRSGPVAAPHASPLADGGPAGPRRAGRLGRAVATRAGPGREELSLAPERFDGDISVGDLVARRFGDEVTTGWWSRCSAACTPGMRVSCRHGRRAAARRLRRARFGSGPGPGDPHDPGRPGVRRDCRRHRPVCHELVGSGRFEVRTGVTVRELGQVASGFELVAGSTRDPELLAADRVVLATPAAPTSRLLAGLAPSAATTWPRSSTPRGGRDDGVPVLALVELVETRPLGSWCRRSTVAGSRRPRSRSPSGTGCARPVARRTCSCCAPRWAGTARSRRSS